MYGTVRVTIVGGSCSITGTPTNVESTLSCQMRIRRRVTVARYLCEGVSRERIRWALV